MLVPKNRTGLGLFVISVLAWFPAQSQTVSLDDPLQAFCGGTSVCQGKKPGIGTSAYLAPTVVPNNDLNPPNYSLTATQTGAGDASTNSGSVSASAVGSAGWTGGSAAVSSPLPAYSPANGPGYTTPGYTNPQAVHLKLQTNGSAKGGAPLLTLGVLRGGSLITGFLNFGTPAHPGAVVTAPLSGPFIDVPEPGTVGLMVAGLLGIGLGRWLRRRSSG